MGQWIFRQKKAVQLVIISFEIHPIFGVCFCLLLLVVFNTDKPFEGESVVQSKNNTLRKPKVKPRSSVLSHEWVTVTTC